MPIQGGAVSAQETTSRAPAECIESIDPHASQIPARRASHFHPFFNFMLPLNQDSSCAPGSLFNNGPSPIPYVFPFL